jgi:hypothetical protein
LGPVNHRIHPGRRNALVTLDSVPKAEALIYTSSSLHLLLVAALSLAALLLSGGSPAA